MKRWWCVLGLALGLAGPAGAQEVASTPAVEVDTSRVVDVVAWAADAKARVKEWYPRIADMLGVQPAKDAPAVRLVFRPFNGLAYTVGSTITINPHWIQDHPEDVGMVVHELTHVLQDYPSNEPQWLIEGIADYVRWCRFEPKGDPVPFDAAQVSYKAGYRITAAFLNYLEAQHPGVVKKAHAALRAGTYKDALFKEWTGKPLDTLWGAFVKSRTKPAGP